MAVETTFLVISTTMERLSDKVLRASHYGVGRYSIDDDSLRGFKVTFLATDCFFLFFFLRTTGGRLGHESELVSFAGGFWGFSELIGEV